jgi:hypothetical protein
MKTQTRRFVHGLLLSAATFIPWLPAAEFAGEASAPAEPLSLWYRRPAREWVEALAVGNGRLGAMVFGGVDTERLQLNEDTLCEISGRSPSDLGRSLGLKYLVWDQPTP